MPRFNILTILNGQFLVSACNYIIIFIPKSAKKLNKWLLNIVLSIRQNSNRLLLIDDLATKISLVSTFKQCKMKVMLIMSFWILQNKS